MHGDAGLGELGEHADRDGPAADVGARAALGRDRAGHEQDVVVELGAGLDGPRAAGPSGATRNRPSTRRRAGAGRTGPVSARPPKQQPEPGHDHRLAGAGLAGDDGQARRRARSTASSMTPSPRMRISSSTAREPTRRPRVGSGRAAPARAPAGRTCATSRSVNGARCSRASRTGSSPRRTSTRAPGGSSHGAPAVAPQHARALGVGEHLDRQDGGRRDDQRPGEQGVRADRHEQQRLDLGPDDRARRRRTRTRSSRSGVAQTTPSQPQRDSGRPSTSTTTSSIRSRAGLLDDGLVQRPAAGHRRRRPRVTVTSRVIRSSTV